MIQRLISRQAALVVAVLMSLVAVFGAPPDAVGAHANQIDSNPSPRSELDTSPDRVIIWFSEPIEESFSTISVLNSAAERVDLGDPARDPSEPSAMSVGLPQLENGTYTVVWKNLSAVDGHKVIGSFVFAVGEPLSAGAQISESEQPLLQSVADPWLRWLVFLGITTVIGGLIFELVVGIPAIYGDRSRESWQTAGAEISARWSRYAWAGLGVTVLAIVGQLLQQVSVLTDTSVFAPDAGTLRSVALDSGWGRLWSYRFVTAMGIGVLFSLARQSSKARKPSEQSEPGNDDADYDSEAGLIGDSIFGQLAAIAGIVFLLLISMSSHNAASPADIKMLAIANDIVYLTAAAVWLGGVFYMALAVPIALRELGGAETSSLLRITIPRFTVLALISAAILVTTGIFSTYMQVTVPAATVTPYGWFLIGKLTLIGPLFAFAAYNGFRLAKKFGTGSELKFDRSLLVEATIAVLVFGSVGWLASLEPGRQYAGRTGIGVADATSFETESEGTRFSVKINPAKVGENDVIIRITKPTGEAIENAVDVRIRLKFLDDDLGEPLVSLEDTGAGIWRLNDAPLNISGNYQAEVVVQRPDAFDSRTAFRFNAQSAATAADTIKPDADTAAVLFGADMMVIGGLVVLLGFRGNIAPSIFGRVRGRNGFVVPGTALALAGVLLVLNVQVLRLGFTDDLRNPYPPTAESVAMGEPVYTNSCASCHGVGGRGDGKAGFGLPKPPADLYVHVPLHSDSILFEFIRDGIVKSGMPAQSGILTDDEMWHLVNFLRASFEEQ
ncbi:MAG: copper resistance protein CopC [Chloroflexi bacterium]|nr:copper resistance protein CopC [Chloroflexota bacterium]